MNAIGKQTSWLERMRKNLAGNDSDMNNLASLYNSFFYRIFRPLKCKSKDRAFIRITDDYVEQARTRAESLLATFQSLGTNESRLEYLKAKQLFQERKRELYALKEKERKGMISDLLSTNDWNQLWKKVAAHMGLKNNAFVVSNAISPLDWMNHFESVFNPNKANQNPSQLHWMVSESYVPELDNRIHRKEIIVALNQMKGKSAPGIDNLPTGLFKQFKYELLSSFEDLFNKVLIAEKFPAKWAHSIVLPLFKRGDRKECNNYRPISLLSCIGKVFTKILTNRFIKWSDNNNCLPACQAGFRAGHSTTDQVFVLNCIIQKRLRSNATTYCAFVDFKQAFDSVNRQALWHKLSALGVSSKFININKSMCDQLIFSVRTKGSLTETRNVNTGVPQGAVNSPGLFIHFLHDLPAAMETVRNNAPGLGDISVPTLLFADDLVLLSTSPIGLQNMLNKLSDYCRKWHLTLNTQKTKIMVFKKSRISKMAEHWRYRNSPIEVVTKFKYLGAHFSYNGKWSVHVSEKSVNAKYVANRLSRFVYSNKNSPLKLFLHLFDSLVSSIIMYNCEILTFSPVVQKYDQIARQFMKAMLGIPQATLGIAVNALLGRLTVEEMCQKKTLRFFHRAMLKNDDSLVKKSMLLQRQMADNGRNCWGLHVKNLLESLCLTSVWNTPEKISQKKLKMIINKKISSISIHRRLETLRDFKSAQYLTQIKLQNRILPHIENLSHSRRRLFIKALLGLHEELIIRNEDVKICRECEAPLDCSFLEHRIVDCPLLSHHREKLFIYSELSPTEDIRKFFLNKMLEPGGSKWSKFIVPTTTGSQLLR